MDPDSSLVISDAISRLRLLERRQETIREKMTIINQNMVEEYKKLLFEVRSLVTDIREIKTNLASLQDNIKIILKEAESFAKKDQVKVLEKYINLWNPLNFVTEEEVKNLLKSKHYSHKVRHKIKKRARHGVRKKVSKRKHR